MCATRAVLLLCLVGGASALSVRLDEEKQRPVAKVIGLLKDMKTELEKEAEKDEELYDNFQCWCQTYGKEKTKAIDTANQQIDALTASIEEGSAKKAQLETDNERLEGEVVEKTKALEEATSIRAKESAEFSTSEQDLSGSIKGLTGAVKALGKAHGESLAQESLLQVQHLLTHHLEQHRSILAEHFSPAQHTEMMSFIQQPVAAKSYNAQSGAIFGILKQMKETFESNLATATKDEDNASEEFGQLKKAKTDETTAANDQIDANEKEHAATLQKLSDDKQDLEDTRAALAADTAFLADLKSRCGEMDKVWEARSKMRADEITAVQEAINILDSDESHDTFSKSLGFIQKGEKRLRRRVASYLRQQGAKLHSPRISLLAVSAKDENEVFDSVKENIDGLIESLKKTQEEEVEEKDFCIEELNKNEDQTTAATNQKEDLEQKIEDLKAAISAAQEAIAQAKQEIHETHVAMKQASGNRNAENKEFQTTVSDQRATQEILKKALVRLEAFYKKAALLQQHAAQEPGAAAPPPPAGFGEYKKAGGSEGAMGLIKMIIKESAATERQAVEDENEAQADYEKFQKEESASVASLNAVITDKTEELAKADGAMTVATTDLANTQDDLTKLAEYNHELHTRCDYLLDNFDVRQQSRKGEIESLNNAKAMFSGADFGL